MKSGKSAVLTKEAPNLFDGEALDTPLQVTQLSVCGDWLIYSIGVHEGSGNYFYGDLYRIKPDGTGKEMLKINSQDNTNLGDDQFTVLDNWIFYNNISEGVDYGYYKIHPDMTGKQKLNIWIMESVNSIIGTIDGFLYYETSSGDIHRCKSDMSQDTVIVKAKDLPNFKTAQDIYQYEINILNNKMYFNAQVWGYRSGYSWRNQFINSTFNQINLDGTGLKTLAKVSSKLDGKPAK
jgi:hypothetical protein